MFAWACGIFFILCERLWYFVRQQIHTINNNNHLSKLKSRWKAKQNIMNVFPCIFHFGTCKTCANTRFPFFFFLFIYFVLFYISFALLIHIYEKLYGVLFVCGKYFVGFVVVSEQVVRVVLFESNALCATNYLVWCGFLRKTIVKGHFGWLITTIPKNSLWSTFSFLFIYECIRISYFGLSCTAFHMVWLIY